MQGVEKDLLRAGAIHLGKLSDKELVELEIRCESRRPPVGRLPRSVDFQRGTQAWVDWLAPSFSGDSLNVTITYADDYGLVHGMTSARNVVKDVRNLVNRYRRDVGRFPYVVQVERHKNRRILHAHCIFGGIWSDAAIAELVDYLARTRGHCRVKRVDDTGGCVAYVTKHLLKAPEPEGFHFRERLPSHRSRRPGGV